MQSLHRPIEVCGSDTTSLVLCLCVFARVCVRACEMVTRRLCAGPRPASANVRLATYNSAQITAGACLSTEFNGGPALHTERLGEERRDRERSPGGTHGELNWRECKVVREVCGIT